MRFVAARLFVVAGFFVVLSFLALKNIWAEYQDSTDTFYIEIAAIELGLAAAAAFGGFLALRRR